jgi:hypothetical protein
MFLLKKHYSYLVDCGMQGQGAGTGVFLQNQTRDGICRIDTSERFVLFPF